MRPFGVHGRRLANPTYQQVCSGKTGHVEVAEITFDPSVISYSDLLHVFFTAARSDHAQSAGQRRG